MRMASGDGVVFAGTAYLDMTLQTPANFNNYSGLTFNIIDTIIFSTYLATVGYGSFIPVGGTTRGQFSISFNAGILTQKGSYYTTLVGTQGSTVQTTFYLASNGAVPYLEID
jgi:hypothetical protein